MKSLSYADSLPTLTFFGDASSKDKDFMVAGGFAVAGNRIAEIESEIRRIQQKAGIQSEFHWSAYRGGHRKTPAYRELVDYGFSLVRGQKAALHVIISKFHGYNHKRGNGDNLDTSVNRMYYQLCLQRLAKYYGHARAIHIRLDEGNDCEDICRMRNQLCADAFQRFAHKQGCNPNCVRTIQAMDSKKSPIIQMADVIIGGIAASRNGVAHSGPKGPLAKYILGASQHGDWAGDTPASERFFTVWNHKTKGTS